MGHSNARAGRSADGEELQGGPRHSIHRRVGREGWRTGKQDYLLDMLGDRLVFPFGFGPYFFSSVGGSDLCGLGRCECVSYSECLVAVCLFV